MLGRPGMHVLLAEDQQAWRELLARSLRDAGHSVTEVSDGPTLIMTLKAMLADEGELPDVVVSDVRMPGATGLEALQRLRTHDDLTHVVLMTAFADAETLLAAARLGAGVLDKPFEPATLVRLVERLNH